MSVPLWIRIPRIQYRHTVAVGLVVFLLLLTYDGALRKWVVPAAQALLLPLKDIIIVGCGAAALIAALRSESVRRSMAMPPTVAAALALYAAWVLVQCFNPALPTAGVALWGAKSHLAYACVLLALPVATARLESLLDFVSRIFPLVVIPVCVVALMQVYAPADSALNEQIGGDVEGLAYFGEANLVRVSGTFSYLSGMAAFTIVAALLGVGLLLAGVRSKPFVVALAAVAVVLPTTGSRAVIVIGIVGTGLMVGSALIARLISPGAALRLATLFAGMGVLSMWGAEAAWEGLSQRFVENREEGAGRVLLAVSSAVDTIEIAGPLGFGTGAANLGAVWLAPDVRPFSWLPIGDAFEEESGRIVLELGWIGLALSLFLRLVLMAWAVALIVKGRTAAARLGAVLALPFLALGLYQGMGVFAAAYQAFAYWLAVALLVMAEAEHRGDRALDAQQDPAGSPRGRA